MVNTISLGSNVNASFIYAMRQSGASLQQIADRIGRTKERVRQLLVKTYGSTKRRLFSTEQLHQLLGLPRNRIMELYRDGIIPPAAEWQTGKNHFILWSPEVVPYIIDYYKTHRRCKICHHLIPRRKWVYCSDACYHEGQKFKYKAGQAKHRRLASIKKCLEKRRKLARSLVSNQ